MDARIQPKGICPKGHRKSRYGKGRQDRQKSDHPWFVRRGHRHFDRPIGLEEAEALATSSTRVRSHSFLPFIHFTLETQKFDRSDGGVKKSKPKERIIGMPSHRDSHIYAYYAFLLSQAYEKRIEGSDIGRASLAYRKLDGKCNIHFASEVFELVRSLPECKVFTFDVTDFFGSLGHKHLKQSWADLLERKQLPEDHYKVYRSLTNYSFVEKDSILKALGLSASDLKRGAPYCSIQEFRDKIRGGKLVGQHNKDRGIPQGSPISAVLSNIFLLAFDTEMSELAKKCGYDYRRYSDDILLVCPPATTMAEIEAVVSNRLGQLGLELNKNKSTESQFCEGQLLKTSNPLQYLGFSFSGGDSILVRSSSYSRYLKKLKLRIRHLAKDAEASQQSHIWRQDLYERYTHLGRRNFISYCKRASKIMNSNSLKKQASRHWKLIRELLRKKEEELVEKFGSRPIHQASVSEFE